MKDEREKSGISRRNFFRGGALAVGGLVIAACVGEETIESLDPTRTPLKTATSGSTPEKQSSPTVQPASFVELGPEATPAVAAYPSSLSVEQIRELVGQGGTLPEGFSEDGGVAGLVEIRRAWFRESGLNVDDPDQEDYVTPAIVAWGEGDSFRWDVVPKDKSGQIVGWLQIEDEGMETGWRFAEGPSWDSHFSPAEDRFKFGLPEKLSPNNSFAVILVGGEHKVLVELNKNGEPRRWLNILQQEMQFAEGAEPSAIYRVNEAGEVQELVDGEWRNVPLPEGTEPSQVDIVIGEDDYPVLAVNGIGEEGVTIAKYAEGEWRVIDFDIGFSPEKIREEAIKLQKIYRKYPEQFKLADLVGEHPDILPDGMLIAKPRSVILARIHFGSQGEGMQALLLWREGAFVSEIDYLVLVKEVGGRRELVKIVAAEILPTEAVRLVEMLTSNFSTNFDFETLKPGNEGNAACIDWYVNTASAPEAITSLCTQIPEANRFTSFAAFEDDLLAKGLVNKIDPDNLPSFDQWWESDIIVCMPEECLGSLTLDQR
jgi:hypothetical protein